VGHNTDFFYALLVLSRNRGGNPRYAVKHFIFRRGDSTIYEIRAEDVRLVDASVLRPPQPPDTAEACDLRANGPSVAPNPERVKDQEYFADFYPDLKPLVAKNTGAPYWKGPLPLVDGSRAEIVAMENTGGAAASYAIATSCKNPLFGDILTLYHERQFRSARHAVIDLERDLNQALYRGKKE
jgi:hypothetical protein